MPDQDEGGRWIVAPAGPGEISLHMAFGEGVELTGDQQEALGKLLRSLEARDQEVTGHAMGESCPSLICSLGGCGKLGSCDVLRPCGAFSGQRAGTGTRGWNLIGTFTQRLQ